MTNHSFLLIVMLFCMFLVSKTVYTLEEEEQGLYSREDLFSVVQSSLTTQRPPTDKSEDRDVAGPSRPGKKKARGSNKKLTELDMEIFTGGSYDHAVNDCKFYRTFHLDHDVLKGWTYKDPSRPNAALSFTFNRPAKGEPPTSVEIFNESESAPFTYSLLHPDAGRDLMRRCLAAQEGHTIRLTHARGTLKWYIHR
ncbi:hypothetical protein PCANC_11003 [Puccinia coronata f. sp. avenae]|uniref:Uncharacterized protein n=1 Tax=Puccinia coronata f. sp. avenae TaxID=200324 RepID=A0A2N5USW7_9BASI|nr:hypothetical protein PCASD_10176 [Puccinia coronata f. sp. avenae]PLW40861.1 hypothetical protein PCANC_11003 [Puccinia coronata f. sp. avenae]